MEKRFHKDKHQNKQLESPLIQAELARALMEGVAFRLKRQMDILADAGIPASSVRMVGGPSETEPWPQIVCDILGLPITIVNGSCAGAVGAAIRAGIGAGLFTDTKEAYGKMRFSEKNLEPSVSVQSKYENLYNELKSQRCRIETNLL